MLNITYKSKINLQIYQTDRLNRDCFKLHPRSNPIHLTILKVEFFIPN